MSYASEVVAKAIEAHGIACDLEGERIALKEGGVTFHIEVREHESGPDNVTIQLNVGTVAPLLGERVGLLRGLGA